MWQFELVVKLHEVMTHHSDHTTMLSLSPADLAAQEAAQKEAAAAAASNKAADAEKMLQNFPGNTLAADIAAKAEKV